MMSRAVASLPRSCRLLLRLRPAALIVNTVTLPWWLLAGRLTRTPTIGHLHEAETDAHRLVRKALVAPLFLAHAVIVISQASREAMTAVQPRLGRRAQLIYNGVPQPPDPPTDATRGQPIRLAVVGRLSPRRARTWLWRRSASSPTAGYDVTLELAGSIFPGYEWYEDELRERADRPDLRGVVEFSGYAAPVWPVLQRADIVLAPSTQEPFGNVVVEAQMSRRPVVAAASHGHLESIADARTGLLVPAGDPAAMADAVERLIADPELADRVARTAELESVRRFSVERYRQEVAALVEPGHDHARDVSDGRNHGSVHKSCTNTVDRVILASSTPEPANASMILGYAAARRSGYGGVLRALRQLYGGSSCRLVTWQIHLI